jgi:hypothetical protein
MVPPGQTRRVSRITSHERGEPMDAPPLEQFLEWQEEGGGNPGPRRPQRAWQIVVAAGLGLTEPWPPRPGTVRGANPESRQGRTRPHRQITHQPPKESRCVSPP